MAAEAYAWFHVPRWARRWSCDSCGNAMDTQGGGYQRSVLGRKSLRIHASCPVPDLAADAEEGR